MVLTGYRIIHVPGYTYTRRFTVKDKADKPAPKPKKPKTLRTRGPRKKKVYI